MVQNEVWRDGRGNFKRAPAHRRPRRLLRRRSLSLIFGLTTGLSGNSGAAAAAAVHYVRREYCLAISCSAELPSSPFGLTSPKMPPFLAIPSSLQTLFVNDPLH